MPPCGVCLLCGCRVVVDGSIYVENKAGLTGQTFPRRRILGHWPYPAPEELAETEPGTQDSGDVPFFYPLHDTRAGQGAKLGRHGRTNYGVRSKVSAMLGAAAHAQP